jgi:hypothetical protein
MAAICPGHNSPSCPRYKVSRKKETKGERSGRRQPVAAMGAGDSVSRMAGARGEASNVVCHQAIAMPGIYLRAITQAVGSVVEGSTKRTC